MCEAELAESKQREGRICKVERQMRVTLWTIVEIHYRRSGAGRPCVRPRVKL